MNAKKQAEEIAALRAEVEALKAKVSPPKSDFKPMSDAEHRDWLHQMRERQAASWMPPSAIRDLVEGEPIGFMAGVVKDNRNAPTSPTGMIPQQSSRGSDVREPLRGYSAPLSNPPGTGPGSPADRIVDEFDRRDRAELARKLGKG
jgi:hypothetical protein